MTKEKSINTIIFNPVNHDTISVNYRVYRHYVVNGPYILAKLEHFSHAIREYPPKDTK